MPCPSQVAQVRAARNNADAHPEHGVLSEEMQWVLRNARLHAADPALRSAAGFAQGAGRAEPVHRAQVGRWENGGVEMTRALVRRYETVLALPEGQLLSAIDFFARSRKPVRSAATLPPRTDPDVDATLVLLERALADERMTGLDWDRLSDNLGRMPHAMVRASDWERIFRRLLQELSLGLHLDYARRAEALARLAGHPRSGAVVAGLAEEVVARPDAQFYNDTLSLLQFTRDPQALSVLLGQLREPTSPSSLRACLIVLTTLVRGARLDPETRLEAVRLAVRHLRDPDQPYLVHRGAANLVRTLGPAGSHRVAAVLTAEDRQAAASIIRDGRAITSRAIREAHQRIRSVLEAGEGRAAAGEPILGDLLQTALGETNEEDRSNALCILMLSPQSSIIGSVHAAAFADAMARQDHVAAHESATVLSWMGQVEDLDMFERYALSPATPPTVAMEAGYVVGNTVEGPGRRRDEREAAFARRVAEVVAAGTGSGPAELQDELHAELLRGLVYVLGMRGRRDLLRALADALPVPGPDPRAMPEIARGILGWWLAVPEHLRPER
ncbi:hypothetical protein GCM10022399_08210 [Terrabacter ginsenosidimutans]|uniref:Uncharacterized protein n=1 Tax=Terrabacter ginsenosidimutans TaxID=490575 RepID=A0ABP7CPG1_9MICO